MVKRSVLFVLALFLVASMAPPATANHEYEIPVWFTWNKLNLNVLVLGVNDPVLGKAINEGIERWEVSIERHAASWLQQELNLRIYNPGLDPVPPEGWNPLVIDIIVAPQGFMAVRTGAKCIAFAPMVAGWGNMMKVVMHEFGHCLGLGHIFNHGQEYEPSFDVMGGAAGNPPPCPSNLNLLVLERVFGGNVGLPSGGKVVMSSGAYNQPSCT